jgi:transglutaminase-like putative cysteine protease
MIHKQYWAAALILLLALGMAAAGCASLKNLYSPNYAIGKDGQLFLALHIKNKHILNKEGIAVEAIMIGGVSYPYSMIEKAPSGQEKNAVHASIWQNAPGGWISYVPGKFLIYPKKPAYTQPPPPPRPARPQPTPQENPTITPEELEKVELAYAETVRDIEKRGRRLKILNRTERAAFIQRWQGQPNTASTDELRNEAFPWYFSYVTSETDIVAMARKEPNVFRKVRMIHDWVADIFAYDYDLLWWMDNVSGQNAIFTLGELVKRERGVCFEYAILFWFLMDASGIETYLISEVIDPENAHAYNMVVIDGTGYIIDTTWDSGNKYKNGAITQWNMTFKKEYFMPGISQSYQLRGW